MMIDRGPINPFSLGDPGFTLKEVIGYPHAGTLAFCHGDFHYANVLWQDHHLTGILDWEYAGYGDRDFAIVWALLLRPGQTFLKTEQEREAFLNGYQKYGSVNRDVFFSIWYKVTYISLPFRERT